MKTIEYLISPLQAKGVYAFCDYAAYRFYSYYKTISTLEGDSSFWNTKTISAKNTVFLGSEKHCCCWVPSFSHRLYMPNTELKLRTNTFNWVSLLQCLDYVDTSECKPKITYPSCLENLYFLTKKYLVLVFIGLVIKCSLCLLLYAPYSGERNLCQN